MTESQIELDFTAPTIGQHHHAAADTSLRAAFAVFPRTGTQREVVLMCIACSPSGRTSEEIQNSLGMSGDTVRPRLIELRKGGWVEDSGTTRPTSSGQDAIVWSVTDKARQHVQKED